MNITIDGGDLVIGHRSLLHSWFQSFNQDETQYGLSLEKKNTQYGLSLKKKNKERDWSSLYALEKKSWEIQHLDQNTWPLASSNKWW